MTQGSKGEGHGSEGALQDASAARKSEAEDRDEELALDPSGDAWLLAGLRAMGDPRASAEMPDATILARVLSQASAEARSKTSDDARSKTSEDARSKASADEGPSTHAKGLDIAVAPAPVIALEEMSGQRSKKRPLLRRGVAMAFAGLAIIATVAYAAQRILSVSAPPEPPPAPTVTAPAPTHNDAPKPQPAPSPSDTATISEEAPPEPTTSATAEPAPAPTTSEKAQAPSADDLLKRAQSLYTAGDTAGATTAYRALIARYPGSGEAKAALITLGQLALRGGQAAEALGHFDRYLASGGPLTIEARVGRIAALRALGRTADERAAIEGFLAQHGDGVHAARLRARLAEISAP